MPSPATSDSGNQLGMVPMSKPFPNGRNGIGHVADDFAPAGDVPVFDLLSNDPLPAIPDDFPLPRTPSFRPLPERPPTRDSGGVSSKTEKSGGEFWFEGDVLMCGCPDCAAPMAVRLWLMMADCWRCSSSIELSEEQEREVRRLLQEREEAKRKTAVPVAPVNKQENVSPSKPRESSKAVTTSAGTVLTPAPRSPKADKQPSPPSSRSTVESPRDRMPADESRRTRPAPEPQTQPSRDPRTPPPPDVQQRSSRGPRVTRQRLAPAAATRARARMREVVRSSTVMGQVRELLRLTPAWLVSLVLHLLVLTLLAMLTQPNETEDEGPTITMSLDVDKDVKEGGNVQIVDPKDEVKFDLPLPSNVDLENEKVRENMIRADQDARQLRIDPNDPNPELAPLQVIKAKISSKPSPRRTFAARDPRVRVEMVKHEGGTTLTEAAVSRGLRWLALHQEKDGSFGLHSFDHAPDCNCGNTGSERSFAAGTSLALLPFLGAGQTHLTGKYKETVAKGLRWMIENQSPNGYLRAGPRTNPGMYAHGQGTIVLCEAYAVEGDESLREPAQRAVNFIVKSQYTDGGWRYSPKQGGTSNQGDTSVVGWQLMALQSARAAGLEIPEDTFVRAGHYLDGVQHKPRRNESIEYAGRYSYLRRSPPTEVMTAEAILCRMYLGWTKDKISLSHGVEWLASEHLPSLSKRNIYYWYYATQTMHHWGGPEWEKWNLKMRDILVQSQEKAGHRAGSWSPQGFKHGVPGGRLYVTALATCTLEVYYRHLPLFKQIELD